MKKLLIKLLMVTLVLGLLVSGLTACGAGAKNWEKPTLVESSKVIRNGGFISETDKYLYFINGVATSTDDNTFGAPVKGALMVQDKSDLSKAPQVVVPKLFAASDYNAGVYIYGDRVYYGTPNTDKNSSGNIANNELTFMSTKIDGTGTETYFTMDSLNVEYRILETDGVVYIVYYNLDEYTIYCYNTKTRANDVIIASDDKAEGKGAISLESYKFLDNDAVASGFAVAYTVTVYAEDYYESVAEKEGYSRAKENYNEVYVVCAKDGKVEGKKILDGKEKEITYSLTHRNGENVYVATKDLLSNTNNFCYNLISGTTVEVKNEDLIASGNLLLENGDVLTLNEGVITLRNALTNDNATQEKLAIVDTATSLVRYDRNSGYIYYLNGSNVLVRVKAGVEDANEEKVSEDTITTVWYGPQFITIGDDEYVFYLDSSSKGASYVKYVKLNAEVKAEDTDDDGESDEFHLEGHEFLAKRLDKDVASIVVSTINEIANDRDESGALKFVEVNGKLTVKSVVKAKELYDAQTPAVKELVGSAAVEQLNRFLDAITWANEYNKLKDAKNIKGLSTEQYNALKAVYEDIKADIESFIAGDDNSQVRALLGNDLNKHFEVAKKEFED